jgi:aerobic carbon-monoxide dehydrogenase medium subunit
MENFNYHRPVKVADAVKLMKKAKDGKFLSGGHTLVPTMKQGLASPTDVIDLSGIKSTGIKVTAKAVIISASATHAEVAADKGLKKAIPGLAALAGGIGDPHVRHKGTIGGSVANNDPAADYPSACMALGAIIHTDARKIPADKFFTGMFSTALKPAEVITAVEFPIPKKSAYAKFPNPASLYAMVGVYVAQDAKGAARVAITGAGPGVFRHPEMEAALSKSFKDDAVAGIKTKARGLNADMHASSEYRAHLINVMARRAVAEAR